MQINDTPGDETKWQDLTYTGKVRMTVSSLITDKMYAFRMASISSDGIGDYSYVAMHKAL